MPRKFRLPSPALVVACIALAVGLTGTAVAANVVPLAKRALLADNSKKLGGKTPSALLGQAAANAEQQASSLRRDLSRVELSTTIVDATVSPAPTSADDTKVAQVALTVPGAGTSDAQYVKIDAHVTMQYQGGTAPFPVSVYVAQGNCGTGQGTVWGGSMAGTIPASGWSYTPISTSWVPELAQLGPRTYVLCAFTSPGNVALVSSVNLVATTFPFRPN